MKLGSGTNETFWSSAPDEKMVGQNALPGEAFYGQLPPGGKVVDIGCGRGGTSKAVSENGFDVCGIDINASTIEQNQTTFPGIDFKVANLHEGIPLPDNSQDGALLSFVLCSMIGVEQRQALFKEINRVLKPGGVLWLNEPLVSDSFAVQYKLSKELGINETNVAIIVRKPDGTSESLTELIEDPQIERFVKHFTREEIEALLSDSFEVLSVNQAVTASPNTSLKIDMCDFVLRAK